MSAKVMFSFSSSDDRNTESYCNRCHRAKISRSIANWPIVSSLLYETPKTKILYTKTSLRWQKFIVETIKGQYESLVELLMSQFSRLQFIGTENIAHRKALFS